MNLRRRRFLQLLRELPRLPALPTIAMAQAYPTRPVRWSSPSQRAGRTTRWHASSVNIYPNASANRYHREQNRRCGNIGMASVLSSSSDGYTIGFAAPNNAINQTFYENLSLISFATARRSAERCCSPRDGRQPGRASQDRNEFIVYAKANPGRSIWHHRAQDGCAHVRRAVQGDDRVNMQHVPYRGSAPATRTCSPIACRFCRATQLRT